MELNVSFIYGDRAALAPSSKGDFYASYHPKTRINKMKIPIQLRMHR